MLFLPIIKADYYKNVKNIRDGDLLHDFRK